MFFLYIKLYGYYIDKFLSGGGQTLSPYEVFCFFVLCLVSDQACRLLSDHACRLLSDHACRLLYHRPTRIVGVRVRFMALSTIFQFFRGGQFYW